MKVTITIAYIKSRGSLHYDPTTGKDIYSGEPFYLYGFLPENWRGTIGDIIDVTIWPRTSKMSLVLSLMDKRTRRLVACAFARRTPLYYGGTVWDIICDEAKAAVETAERFARGEATKEELEAARTAAMSTSGNTAGTWNTAWGGSFSGSANYDPVWETAFYTAFSAQVDAERRAKKEHPTLDASSVGHAAFEAARNTQLEITREFC
jgi:hypothetical protein